ncbi:hypothetical protein THAOC_31640, partial [Thalassiosira oceanica]
GVRAAAAASLSARSSARRRLDGRPARGDVGRLLERGDVEDVIDLDEFEDCVENEEDLARIGDGYAGSPRAGDSWAAAACSGAGAFLSAGTSPPGEGEAPQGKNCADSALSSRRLTAPPASGSSGTASPCSFDWWPPFRVDGPPSRAILESLPAWSTRDVHLIPRAESSRDVAASPSRATGPNSARSVVGFGRKVASWKALVELFK